jgi:hypothetical protein
VLGAGRGGEEGLACMGVKQNVQPLCVCARACVCVHVFATTESVCVGDPACMCVCTYVLVCTRSRMFAGGGTDLTLYLNCVVLFNVSPVNYITLHCCSI